MKVKDIIKGNSVWIPNARYKSISPVVTVTLPTYRRAESGYFQRAVDSVLNQKYRNFELIIIDDGSTDGTAKLIDDYMKKDRRVSCLRHKKNVGLPCIGSFEAYLKSRGTYLAYMFDDNTWDEDFLLKTINYMEDNKSKATYGIARSFDVNGNYLDFQERDLAALSFTNCIGNGAVVLHREVINKVGFYDPHLALTRLCDWDLWKRILIYYDFEFTGIFACNEYGVALSDSLGNSLKMKRWASLEQTQRDRCRQLLPDSFLEYDIIGSDSKSTDYFRFAVSLLYERYSDKFWFSESDKSYLRLKENSEIRNARKRVLVLLPNFDATFLLGFNLLSYIDSDFVIYPIHLNNFNESDLLYADAVILVRYFFAAENVVSKCEKWNVPVFFFLDDNFVALASENDAYIPYARYLIENRLDGFRGVIASTEALKNVLEDYEFHDQITLFRPIVTTIFNSEDDGIITYGFMGGHFREQIFSEIVMPAICKVAKKNTVRLVCPSSLNGKIPQKYLDNIEVVYIDWLFSVDTIVNRYKKYNIDFLIHCGPDLENNRYKTENALINAVRLGATLVTSNVEPYNLNPLIYTSNNTIREWTEKLLELIENSEEVQINRRYCREYCEKKYSAYEMNAMLNEAMRSVVPMSIEDILSRHEDLAANPVVVRTETVNRCEPFIDFALCFSKPITDHVEYVIEPKIVFSEVGIIFSVDGVTYPTGKVIAELFMNSELVGSGELDINNIKFREISYFILKSSLPAGQYVLKIRVEYAVPVTDRHMQLGVFENRSECGFLYRLLRKIGIKWMKPNVLFIDPK